MREKQAERILQAHGVHTKHDAGRLYAFDAWTEADGTPGGEWLPVTATEKWLRWFLNY